MIKIGWVTLLACQSQLTMPDINRSLYCGCIILFDDLESRISDMMFLRRSSFERVCIWLGDHEAWKTD